MTERLTFPRVFVVHEPLRKASDDSPEGFHWERVRDLTPAREYGDLVYVYPAGHLSADQDYLFNTARAKLASFTAQDFVLMSGDTLAMAQVAMTVGQFLEDNEREVKYLIWDKKRQRYFCQALWAWPEDTNLLDLTAAAAGDET